MSTFDEFVKFTAQYTCEHTEQRAGQAAFNALSIARRDLSEVVRGTDLDPFYDGARLTRFWQYVEQHWYPRARTYKTSSQAGQGFQG